MALTKPSPGILDATYLANEAVATTSGTTVTLATGIPAWVKKITLTFNGVSTTGTDNVQLQLGDAGGYETTGYAGETESDDAVTFQAWSSATGAVVYVGMAATHTLYGVASRVVAAQGTDIHLGYSGYAVERQRAAAPQHRREVNVGRDGPYTANGYRFRHVRRRIGFRVLRIGQDMYSVLSRNEPLPLQNYTFRKTNGIDVSWRGGDLLIADFGNWFDAPFFKLRIWVYVPWRILPFIRRRFGETVGYLGAKAWGVDSEHYLNWISAEHVRVGSVALVLSARFDADDQSRTRSRSRSSWAGARSASPPASDS